MLPDRVSNPGPLTYESGALPIQTEKSQPSGQLKILATGLTFFPALSICPRVGIYRSASETGDKFYLSDRCILFIINSELNVLKIIICLRESEVSVERILV